MTEGPAPTSRREEVSILWVGSEGPQGADAELSRRPDLVVAELASAESGGLDALARLRQRWPGVRILFLTAQASPAVARRALAEGASGFLLKQAPISEMMAAVRTVVLGGTYLPAEMMTDASAAADSLAQGGPGALPGLSRRQREILGHLVEGRSPKEIAGRLGISHRTVEFHKYQAMMRLGCRTFPELIRMAVEQGIRAG